MWLLGSEDWTQKYMLSVEVGSGHLTNTKAGVLMGRITIVQFIKEEQNVFMIYILDPTQFSSFSHPPLRLPAVQHYLKK